MNYASWRNMERLKRVWQTTCCKAVVVAGLMIWAAMSSGCVSSSSTADQESPDTTRNELSVTQDGEVTAPLEPARPNIKTIQLYQTGDEGSLPVLGMGSGQTLTLEFDIVRASGEPVSVFFYHADRSWRYDLQPGEYMESFPRDDVLSYSASMGTEVPYTHYSYRFPNRDIGFTQSGNYVVRVTEQGNEDAVLFEKAFFVSENAAELRLDMQAQIGSRRAYAQPVARLYPPQLLENNPFDVRLCFMRSGNVQQIKCVEEPTLIEASFFQFQLPDDQGFSAEPTTRVLDLSQLQESNEIELVDYNTSPYTVVLSQDYARFGGDVRSLTMNGQALVSSVVQTVSDPDVDGQYARVLFRYVPVEEQPLDGTVVVSGSFNEWQYEDKHQLTWNAQKGYYEGEALIKQGVHEYQYRSTGEPTYRMVESSTAERYTALVYFYDTMLQTDRLLAVNSIYGR